MSFLPSGHPARPRAIPVRVTGMCLLLLALGVASQAARAQRLAAPDTARPPLVLAAVLAAAERANPKAEAARQLARAAEARVPGATRPPDPELQLGLMNWSLPRLAPDETLGMRQIQLMQMVPIPGKLSAAGRAARARAGAAGARAADARAEAREQAAMAFHELWEARQRIALVRESRRLVEDAAAVAASMYRVGEGRQADVLRARVELARMDEEVVRMEAMADGARARLAAATGLPGDSLAGEPAAPGFPDSLPTLAELEAIALGSSSGGRPMLAAGAAEARAASADERLARRELWPDVTIGVQYGERSMGEMGTDRMGSLMVGATLPIFARSRQLRMREEAGAMRGMAEAELAAMRADTRARLVEAYAALASARRLAALYRTTVLPQAEAAATSALASYRVGAVDFMTVLDDRMTVNRYREELASLAAAEGRAWAELEMLTGRPLVDAPFVGGQR